MKDIYEATELKWHKNEKNHHPRKDGEYLCKCIDVEAIDMKAKDGVIWSKPYFAICDLYDDLWICDGVVIAWAEIPKCSFELE